MENIQEDVLEFKDSDAENKYLFFLAGDVLYAIEALKASEIVEYNSITKVPMMNSYVKGVTNIRGNIVPVIDLLDRFGLGDIQKSDKTSIVVINYRNRETPMQIGIIIDEVYEVDNIDPSDIKKAPEFGSKINAKFILKMGKYDKKYIPILNTDTILDIDELSKIVV